MNLRITIYSDLMEWEENINRYGISLHKAYVNGEEYELDISKIPDDFLLPIIQNHIKDDELDEIQSIEGGLRIDLGDLSLEWTCCENITDFYHWEDTLNISNENWNRLWIGHPWIYFRIQNDKIQFSDYTDDTEIIPENLQIKMELNYLEFTSKLLAKINEMESFKQKLKQVIIGSELEEKEIIIEKIL